MGKQRGARTKKKATKIRSQWRKQGYKDAHVFKNPKTIVSGRTKRYAVVTTLDAKQARELKEK